VCEREKGRKVESDGAIASLHHWLGVERKCVCVWKKANLRRWARSRVEKCVCVWEKANLHQWARSRVKKCVCVWEIANLCILTIASMRQE
jgi:hypothetical protein